MRRVLSMAVAFATLSLTAPLGASAQVAAYVGGGFTGPTGDYAEFPGETNNGAKAGWQAMGGVLVPVGDAGVSVGGQAFYGSNSHDLTGEKTNLYGATALVGLALGETDAVRPFVFGGVGIISHAYKSDASPSAEETFTGPAGSGGAGVSIPVGGVRCMLAGSFTRGFGDVDDTTFFGGSAAVQFPLGG